MYQRSYTLGDVGLTIEHSQEQQAVRIAELWEQLFAVVGGMPDDVGSIVRFQFHLCDADTRSDSTDQLISDASGLQVWKTRSGFRLKMASAVFDLDPSRGEARGAMDESFWRLPADVQRRMLLLAFVILAHERGCYAIHANGVARADAGLLIIGPSGSGKTTLGLTLVRQGWDYLSDDVVLLRREESVVAAFGVTSGFSCTPRTAAVVARVDHPQTTDDKSLLMADDIGTSRSVNRCYPNCILFPKIASRSTSRLTAMSGADALTCLIQFSAGIMVDRSKAQSQLAMLTRLVDQARCFRLEAAADVLSEPSRIQRLLCKTLEV